MTELERRLLALGQAVDFPETPAIAASVHRRLSTGRRVFIPRYLAIAAALLIVTLGALLAFPPTRDAIAGFFGLKGVLIQRVPSLTTPSRSPGVSVGERLDLGQQVSLQVAQAALPYRILYPQSLGPPDATFLLQPTARKGVALVWNPRAGLPQAASTGVGVLVIEFAGQVQPDFFVKMLGPDATLEQVQVNGNPGYWISGKPHGFFFLDAQGAPQEDTFRLAGNTLIWDQGSLTIRIESGLDQAGALALARTAK